MVELAGPAETAVKKRLAEIKAAESHFEKAFRQMLADQQFARGIQWGEGEQAYVVNITLRHIQTRTAGLYAKNPKVQVKRQPKIDGVYWDGEASSLQAVQQRMAENMRLGLPPDPMDRRIAEEAEAILRQRAAMDRLGQSLLLVQNYFLDEGFPSFKEQAKQCVRQALTCGVGYIKIAFHRPGEVRPEPDAILGDVAERQARLEGILDAAAEDEAIEAERAAFDASLAGDGAYLEPEGLLYTWPSATALLPDPKTRSLIGWQGARWIAEKFYLAKEEVKKIYGVDLENGSYTSYSYLEIDGKPSFSEDDKRFDGESAAACVYEVWDKARGTVETVCEGYRAYLRPPTAPMRIEGFFPYRALVLNDVTDDKKLFPPSDVFLLRDMQLDTNRARQGVREHRVANRPRQIIPEGIFEEEDEKRLASARAHDVIKVKVAADTDVRTLIQAMPTIPITAELYDVSAFERDALRTVGSQEANFGPTGGATATEVGVAESSRQTAMASQMDDLDLFLSAILRASGQILLRNLSPDRARQIAGPGASWPEWGGEAFSEDLILSIKSGSSGMPNQTQQAANLERLLPFALQTGGFSPVKIAEKIAEGMGMADDLLDLIDASQPSILALNALAGSGATRSAANALGAPEASPADQGRAGNNNAPRGMGRPGGAQPGLPAPQ